MITLPQDIRWLELLRYECDMSMRLQYFDRLFDPIAPILPWLYTCSRSVDPAAQYLHVASTKILIPSFLDVDVVYRDVERPLSYA